MPVNKVEYFGETLIDISDTTVTAETLPLGLIAYDKSGNKILGYADTGSEMSKLIDGSLEQIATNAEMVRESAFINASRLRKAVLNQAWLVSSYAFFGCSSLDTLIIKYTAGPCRLQNTNALYGTKIGDGQGFIYFYKDYVEYYKTMENWMVYADQIRAIEDYPEITGG